MSRMSCFFLTQQSQARWCIFGRKVVHIAVHNALLNTLNNGNGIPTRHAFPLEVTPAFRTFSFGF